MAGFDMHDYGRGTDVRSPSQEHINGVRAEPALMIKQDISFAVEEGSLEGSEGGDVAGGETRCVHAS